VVGDASLGDNVETTRGTKAFVICISWTLAALGAAVGLEGAVAVAFMGVSWENERIRYHARARKQVL